MTTCPRCGAPMLTLTDATDIAVRADKALATMRLALPSELTAGVRALASVLPCLAGTCSRKEKRR